MANDSFICLAPERLTLKLSTPDGTLEVSLGLIEAQILGAGLLLAAGSNEQKLMRLGQHAGAVMCAQVKPLKAAPRQASAKLRGVTVKIGGGRR